MRKLLLVILIAVPLYGQIWYPVNSGATVLKATNSAQFNKVNNTLADVTGISITLTPGVWIIQAHIPITTNGLTGYKVGIGGTASRTATNLELAAFDYSLPGFEAAAMYNDLVGNVITGATTQGSVKIIGSVTISSGGTLTITFAQNVTDAGNPASVLTGAVLTGTQ